MTVNLKNHFTGFINLHDSYALCNFTMHSLNNSQQIDYCIQNVGRLTSNYFHLYLSFQSYSAMFGHPRNPAHVDLMSSSQQNTSVPEMSQQHQHPQPTKFHKKSFNKSTSSSLHGFSLGSGSGLTGSSGGTRLKFSGFGLGAMSGRDDGGMADCQL